MNTTINTSIHTRRTCVYVPRAQKASQCCRVDKHSDSSADSLKPRVALQQNKHNVCLKLILMF